MVTRYSILTPSPAVYVTMDQHSQMDQIQSDWITLDYLYMYDAYKKYIFHMYYPLVNIQKTMEQHPF